MAFTYQQTNFVNRKTYNEQTHADALHGGIPNFANFGLEYNEASATITNGRGINGGLPFILGRDSETQDITASFTGFLAIKTTLNNGTTSTTELVELTTVPENTSMVKHFAIYELSAGAIVSDLRHVEYVKSVDIISLSSDEFAIAINGTISNTFTTSAISQGYIKQDAEERFAGSWTEAVLPDSSDAFFSGKSAAEIINLILDEIELNDIYVQNKKKTIALNIPSSSKPNMHEAFATLLLDTYNYEATSTIYVNYEFINHNFAASHKMTIRLNNNAREFQFTCDNFGLNYETEDSAFFRASILNVGGVVQKATIGTDQDRTIGLYEGASYLYDTLSIALELGDYNIGDFEKICMRFEPYNYSEQAVVDAEAGFTYEMMNATAGVEDGFYRRTGIYLKGYNSTLPCFKSWDIDTSGVIRGRTPLSDETWDNYVDQQERRTVCVGIWGVLTERSYIDNINNSGIFARSDKLNNYPIIKTSELAPDTETIYLKNANEAYDIYDLNSAELTTFEAIYKEARGDD